MSLSLLLLPLLLNAASLVQADYAVFDVFASGLECEARQPVQASFYREMGVCIDLPPDFPTSFFYSTKKSYRFDACANTFPRPSLSLSVFDEKNCDGDGLTIDMSHMLPGECTSNVLVTCQEKPMAMVEKWPTIEMWGPTSFESSPSCSPNDKPHEYLSICPKGAIYQDFPSGKLNGLKATCRNGEESNSMKLNLYEDVDTSPDTDNLPHWTTENNVDTCHLVGDLVENCPDCLSLFPPGEGVMHHLAYLAGLSSSERVYLAGAVKRSSVKFRCY